MTRRELLSLPAGAVLGRAVAAGNNFAPVAPVAIARCTSYNEDLATHLTAMFDQLGGAGRLVANKTVAIKLNLTGNPAQRIQGRPLGVTHYTHPKTVAAMIHVLHRAGARRIRLLESCWATAGPLEEYLLDCGWNVRSLSALAPNVEFENTNALGRGKKYVRLKVPGKAYIYPAYELNHSWADADVVMSMAKLKNHETCGITLALKNMFGITPASIYGDDAGADEPNEKPGKGRVEVCHLGKRQPATAALPELDPASSRDPGYRMPRITAELAAARPIDISFIDGVETIAGGEGPWSKALKLVQPGLLILGTNPVSTDTVATAAMGYNPRALRGEAPFTNCDNTLLLAEEIGVGAADVSRIDVRGVALRDAVFAFPR
jgi:uncharacterized protein (DUF362 family)